MPTSPLPPHWHLIRRPLDRMAAAALVGFLLACGSPALATERAQAVASATADDVIPSGEPHPLSVAPLNEVAFPESRPEWLNAAPSADGDVEVWPVTSLLRPTAEEARESLRLQMRGAVFAYAEQVLGAERVARLASLDQLSPEIELLPLEDRYAGTALLGDQTVYEEAVRLRFDERYRRELGAVWRQAEVRRRLLFLGVAGGGVFCLLLPVTGVVRRMANQRGEHA